MFYSQADRREIVLLENFLHEGRAPEATQGSYMSNRISAYMGVSRCSWHRPAGQHILLQAQSNK